MVTMVVMMVMMLMMVMMIIMMIIFFKESGSTFLCHVSLISRQQCHRLLICLNPNYCEGSKLVWSSTIKIDVARLESEYLVLEAPDGCFYCLAFLS